MAEDPRTKLLRRLHAALVTRFGSMPRSAEERRSAEWTLVQGLIGSRMNSAASSAVADRVLAEHGSWEAVAALDEAALARALEGVRFPNQSAKRVSGVFGAIRTRLGRIDLGLLDAMATDEALGWLESLPGTGRKIAAQVLNTSPLARRALVLDTHHLRILARLGLIGARDDTAKAYDSIMPLLPSEWDAETVDEHHMLMKKLGRAICTPKAPKCPQCPALALCPTGQGVAAG